MRRVEFKSKNESVGKTQIKKTIVLMFVWEGGTFSIHISAIMHRISIVERWIIRTICSCAFFVGPVLTSPPPGNGGEKDTNGS